MQRFSLDSLRSLARDQRGLTTVEYIIVLCLIAAVAVGTWKTFGDHVHTRLKSADTKISKTIAN